MPPASPEPGAEPGAAAEAEELLLSLGRTDRSLAMSLRKARSWVPLAVPWLALGLTSDQLRRHLTDGLDAARSPLGALRWRLEHALPEAPLPSPSGSGSGPPASPHTARMRECAGQHLHPCLFLPPPDAPDETRCPACREPDAESDANPEAAPGARTEPPPGSGRDAFRAARAATSPPRRRRAA